MSDNVDKIIDILHKRIRSRGQSDDAIFAEIAQQINALQNEWISVDERLPECDLPVRCYEGGNEYIGMRYYEEGLDGWYWMKHNMSCFSHTNANWNDYEADDDYTPTHWQPLPKPPNDELNDYYKHPEKY